MYDYMHTHRPCFLYCNDLKQYCEVERGLYIDINDMPFPMTEIPEQLINCICNFNQSKYNQAVRDFLLTYNFKDDGHATEKIINYLKNEVLEAKK
jgi:CDP-glycerol glycerophosphotransferase